ncbi:hypothetical protein [Methanospirillum lacunae]
MYCQLVKNLMDADTAGTVGIIPKEDTDSYHNRESASIRRRTSGAGM